MSQLDPTAMDFLDLRQSYAPCRLLHSLPWHRGPIADGKLADTGKQICD
jgi:hypothetical protein